MITRKDILYAYKIYYDEKMWDTVRDEVGEKIGTINDRIETVSKLFVAQSKKLAETVFTEQYPIHSIKSIEELGTVDTVVTLS